MCGGHHAQRLLLGWRNVCLDHLESQWLWGPLITCLLTIRFASATEVYSVHPMGVSQLLFVDPLDVRIHEEQQTPRDTIISPMVPSKIDFNASLA